MMAQTSKTALAKDKGRSHPATKGCSCKRSQCIKNYCDCYQSMTVCTLFCRCVGCRNTEERMALEPRTPSRNSNAIKKDRMAAMSAKAATTKECTYFPGPSVSKVSTVTAPPLMGMAPIEMVRLAPETFGAVLEKIDNGLLIPFEAKETDEVLTSPDEAKEMQSTEEEAMVTEPPHAELNATPNNLFTPTINEAQLICTLTQASEAEQLGLFLSQVGRLAIAEFTKCFKDVCEKMFNS